MATTSGVHTPLPNVPPGVEVSVRQGAHGTVFILVNLSKQAQSIALPSGMKDLLEGGSKTSVKVEVYGVAVLAQSH
jgi:beta-galactosidase